MLQRIHRQPVILSAVRTPVGKFQGALSSFSATELGARVVAEAVRRAGIQPDAVDEVIMGNVVQAGLGQNPARQAALRGGLNPRVAAMTINKVCGSGLKAVALAAQGILLEEIEIAVAGGMESMSNCPYLLPERAQRLSHRQSPGGGFHDSRWPVGRLRRRAHGHHRRTGGREIQDLARGTGQICPAKPQRAVQAMNSCFIESQILPIEVPQKKGDPILIKRDESPRADASLEALGKLRPAFKKDGTVTAGNAPGTNDGAAAVVVASEETALRLGKTPMARMVAQAVSGVEPKWVMMAPVEAVEKLLRKTGWDRDRDVDLYELNEAFAVQAIAVMRELRLDPEKVNVNGGAVAIGHPIGASGARILVTLLYEMQRRNVHRGIAALCLGGGNAVALAVER